MKKPRTILIYGLIGPPIGSLFPSILFLAEHFFGKYSVQNNDVIENFAMVIGVVVGLAVPSYIFGSVQAIITGAAIKYFSDENGRFGYFTAFINGICINTFLCGLLAIPYMLAGYTEALAAVAFLAGIGVASSLLVRVVFADKFRKLDANE